MTLRTKTLSTYLLTLAGLLGGFSLLLDLLVMDSFDRLEAEKVHVDTQREVAGIQERLEALARASYDWGTWDDTYQYMADRNTRYVESNLVAESLSKLVNLIAFVDLDGNLVEGRAYESDSDVEAPLPAELLPHFQPHRGLWRGVDDREPATGMLLLPHGVLLAVGQPILTSHIEGPGRGTVVMGRYLTLGPTHDPDRAVSFVPYDRREEEADFLRASASLDPKHPFLLRRHSQDLISGYHLFLDLHGQPVAVLRVNEGRPINAHAAATVRLALWSLLGCGLLFGALAVFLVETQVLRKLGRLSRTVAGVERERDYSLRLSPEGRDELGAFASAVNHMLDTIAADRSALKAAKDEAERLAAEAQAASVAKSRFLANMSHEIRTPMNAVVGMADLLMTTSLAPGQREWVETIRSGANTLLTIINDILDFSKIESGKLELESLPFDPRSVVTAVGHILSPQVSRKGLQFRRQVDDEVPTLLSGDPVRLQQVLLNLAGNAVKFTAKGKVEVEVRCASCDGKRAALRFAVRDSGIGISAAEMPRLFESFSQVDASVTRRFGGTGLGLAISKRITELMGGTIGVESQPGRGSTFWFTAEFPVCPPGTLPAGAPASAEGGAPVASVGDLRILVAEDNDVNQIVIRSLLEKLGCRPEIVETGRAAVQAVSSETFDVVLMDMQMPDMDGYTAMGAIRTIERPLERRTPIVALTAHALKGDREKCLMAGADEYLAKPVRLKELAAVLSRIRPNVATQPAPVER